jgi:16S rRNA processing protein RimM
VADAVAVGEIVGAHALRGMVRVRAYQPPASSLAAGRTVLLEHAGVRRALRVLGAARQGRGLVLLALEGVGDRDGAEGLVGARVLVRAADLPSLAAGEFYYHEVVGFLVETIAGEPLGTIAGTFATGTNDVWIVRQGGREQLIPVIADVVRAIDRPARRVVIDPLPGLLD